MCECQTDSSFKTPTDPHTFSEGIWALQAYINSLQSPSQRVCGSIGKMLLRGGSSYRCLASGSFPPPSTYSWPTKNPTTPHKKPIQPFLSIWGPLYKKDQKGKDLTCHEKLHLHEPPNMTREKDDCSWLSCFWQLNNRWLLQFFVPFWELNHV